MARPRPVVEVSFCLDSLKLIFETRFLYNSLRLADYDETFAVVFMLHCCTALFPTIHNNTVTVEEKKTSDVRLLPCLQVGCKVQFVCLLEYFDYQNNSK